jgi:hypothetical protein
MGPSFSILILHVFKRYTLGLLWLYGISVWWRGVNLVKSNGFRRQCEQPVGQGTERHLEEKVLCWEVTNTEQYSWRHYSLELSGKSSGFPPSCIRGFLLLPLPPPGWVSSHDPFRSWTVSRMLCVSLDWSTSGLQDLPPEISATMVGNIWGVVSQSAWMPSEGLW